MSAKTPRLRAVTYCRISDDREGTALGVERQSADCDALVKRRKWQPVGRYVDNDLSAYSGKPRPQYLAMLDAIRSGLVDVVVAWDPDRLHRSPAELETFIALVEKAGVSVETVNAGLWDLSTPAGRMIARQLGSVARYESEHKAERVRRALEQRAGMGRSHGRIPYGWTRTYAPDGTPVEVENPSEADVVRRIAKGLVKGHSLGSITRALNSDGVPVPSGKGQWTNLKVRAVVQRERNVGLRVYKGEIVGPGDWPAILERATWEQVQAILKDPARKMSTGSEPRYLCSGIAKCGVCGAPLRAGMNRSTPSYRCAATSCVSRNRQDLDTFVVGLVAARLGKKDAVDLLNPRDDSARRAVAEVAELRAKLDNAADDHADGRIDREQLLRITERLRPRLEAAQARARNVDNAPVFADVVGQPDARAALLAQPIARQRSIVAALVEITVLPARQGARAFDPDSVQISWRAS